MECENRQNIGYFAYNSNTGGCSCYSKSDGCPDDDLYNDAVKIVLESEKASISYLQRRLKIGYNLSLIHI